MDENIYLEEAIEIKKWIDNSEKKLPPSKSSKDEIEKKLGKELNYIRKKIVKPYLKIKNEKKKEIFEEKNPWIQEIIKIMGEIDEIAINSQLGITKREKAVVDLDMELSKNEPVVKIEFDKSNSKQNDLADLIIRDLKIRKKLENANELKKKYENNNWKS